MGLDMYLSAKRTGYDYGSKDVAEALAPLADQFLPPDANNIGTVSIEREVAYWRKANQIHGWFVANVQGGVDECQPSDVSLPQLIELRDLCAKLVANRDDKEALKLLPPQSGFFFGGTELDDYYWGDVEETAKRLTAIIDWHQASGAKEYEVEFTYHASW